ncbi:hypothetical protein FHS23_002170 [Prauserella isguenensis]|uniref:Uncharacterized protein n=1 Tax=Prauserella isguenensis TaxID=1470180 RepID=A0A839S367_9PSEU|nr:hypothetical protein [Prauserella isguenensis]MBB3051147.1 hypothetical protein [Prauserella isguenensis]
MIVGLHPAWPFEHGDQLDGVINEYPDILHAYYYGRSDDFTHRRACIDMAEWNRRTAAVLEAEAEHKRRAVQMWEDQATDPNWRNT